MAFPPSWVPSESALVLFNERTWLAGMVLTAVAYGVVLTLFVNCTHVLIKTMRTNNHKALKMFWLVYISLMLLFGTLYVGAAAKMTELSFIDYRLFPGGPSAFEELEFSIPIDEMGNVSFVLANWFADALLVWRFSVIYLNCRFPTWVVMFIPVTTFLASFSMGVCWLIQISAPSSSPWASSSSTINFTAPYFWLSLALNISMTLAIVCRLLVFRWRVSSTLGSGYGRQYTSIAAMLIESAFLYSSFSLLFLIPFALGNPIQNTFVQMLGEVQIIAPLLIIYRVASGEAWSSSTSTQILSVFGTAKSSFSARPGMRVHLETTTTSQKSYDVMEMSPVVKSGSSLDDDAV